MRGLIISAVIVSGALVYGASWAERLASLSGDRARALVDGSTSQSSAAPRVTDARSVAATPRQKAETKTVTLYKWRDEHGVMHFETQSPPADVQAETLTVRVRPAERRPTKQARQNQPSRPPASIESKPWSVYLPGGQEALMDQLRRTLDRLDTHQRVMERISEEL